MVRPSRNNKNGWVEESIKPKKKIKLGESITQALTEQDPLERINFNCAGIDIGSKSHFVAVPRGRDKDTVREFSAFTKGLYEIMDWKKMRCEQCCDGIHWYLLDSLIRSTRRCWA